MAEMKAVSVTNGQRLSLVVTSPCEILIEKRSGKLFVDAPRSTVIQVVSKDNTNRDTQTR